tara:strand:- start:322 stop:519 length:198 start_codon:yes stop_codon:yes gene_type:complete
MFSSKPLLEVCVVSSPVEPGVQAPSMKSDKNGTGENFMGMVTCYFWTASILEHWSSHAMIFWVFM